MLFLREAARRQDRARCRTLPTEGGSKALESTTETGGRGRLGGSTLGRIVRGRLFTIGLRTIQLRDGVQDLQFYAEEEPVPDRRNSRLRRRGPGANERRARSVHLSHRDDRGRSGTV